LSRRHRTVISRQGRGSLLFEAAKILAQVARTTHDLNLAEDCTQDALLAALQTWSAQTIPEQTGAWLLTAARRNSLDRLRHARIAAPLHERLGQEPTCSMPSARPRSPTRWTQCWATRSATRYWR